MIELDLRRPIGECDKVIFRPLSALDAIDILEARDEPVRMIEAVAKHGDLCGDSLENRVNELAPADAADLIEIGMALLGLSADGEFQETAHNVDVRENGGVYFPLFHEIGGQDDPVVALEFRSVTFGEIKDVYERRTLKEKFKTLIQLSAIGITRSGDSEPITDQHIQTMRAEDAVGIVLHVLPVFFGSGRRWRKV